MSTTGIEGKVALVTGGASGIGAATARHLSAAGAKVTVADRDLTGAEALAESLPGEALAVGGDVSSEADVEAMVTSAVDRFGRLDLHHLNAGVPGPLDPFEDLSVEDFDEVIAVDLRSVFLGLREAFRQYSRQQSGGAIVVTASIGSLRGSSDLIPYHTAKHGVLGLMRCAAVHGAERDIRVNAIAPGIVLTGLFAGTKGSEGGASDWEKRARIAPQRRPGTAEEVADLVAFLLGEQAGFLTGEVISIDGGATAMNPARPSGQRVEG